MATQNTTFRVKRSAVASAVPTTAQLALGEIAINTNDGKLYIKKDNGTPSIVEVGAGGGSGTVTSTSIVSANGLAGTVATATTTPAITLSTTVSGVLKGNGTAISAAVAGTDYLTVLTGDATTSGNAITLTSVGIAGTYGQVTTDAKGRVTAGVVINTVANGGTGFGTYAVGDLLYASATSAMTKLAAGTNGHVLTLAAGVPSWAAGGGGSSSNTYKEAVRAATTANIALTGNVTLDGITTAAGDRILVKNQTTSTNNGIYVASATAWARATDFDTSGAEVANGAIIPIQLGTRNAGTVWQLIGNGGTIGNSFVFSPVGMVLVNGQSALVAPITTNYGDIAIGPSCTATGGGSGATAVAIGSAVTATGSGSVAIGSEASATGNNTICFGRFAAASGARSIVISNISGGTVSAADTINIGGGPLNLPNSINLTAFNFGNVIGNFGGSIFFGTGQWSDTQGLVDYVVGTTLANSWLQTANATPTEIGVQSASGTNTPTGRIVLANASMYLFNIDIAAREHTTGANKAAFNLSFGISRDATAASTALVGTPTLTTVGVTNGASAWTVSVTADTTNGRPAIMVTGAAATTIRWVMNLRITKCSS